MLHICSSKNMLEENIYLDYAMYFNWHEKITSLQNHTMFLRKIWLMCQPTHMCQQSPAPNTYSPTTLC